MTVEIPVQFSLAINAIVLIKKLEVLFSITPSL